MKRYLSNILVLILIISLIPANTFAANNNLAFVPDLDTGIPATVDYGTTFESLKGFFDISISNVPDGADILNGIYPGWCIQHYIVGVLQDQPATLYASTSPNLPPDVAELPWNEINYVLNHKIQGPGKPTLEFIQDVQNAIWILLGEENPAASLETQQMVANANAHPDYVPGEGEITAVIIYSDGMSTTDAHSVQESIIEVKRNHTPTQTATPTGTATLPTETDTTPTKQPPQP